jgi:hypothetical protein
VGYDENPLAKTPNSGGFKFLGNRQEAGRYELLGGGNILSRYCCVRLLLHSPLPFKQRFESNGQLISRWLNLKALCCRSFTRA